MCRAAPWGLHPRLERALKPSLARNSKGPQAGQLLSIINGNGAQKRTRTSTSFRIPAPEAGASTNSAIWATESDVRGWPFAVNRLFEVSVSVLEKLYGPLLRHRCQPRFLRHAGPDGRGRGRGRSRRAPAVSAPSDRENRRHACAPRSARRRFGSRTRRRSLE
jgi:hypothetical protein